MHACVLPVDLERCTAGLYSAQAQRLAVHAMTRESRLHRIAGAVDPQTAASKIAVPSPLRKWPSSCSRFSAGVLRACMEGVWGLHACEGPGPDAGGGGGPKRLAAGVQPTTGGRARHAQWNPLTLPLPRCHASFKVAAAQQPGSSGCPPGRQCQVRPMSMLPHSTNAACCSLGRCMQRCCHGWARPATDGNK